MKRKRNSSGVDTSDPLFQENNGVSPIIARKITFESDSDSDPEVVITSQANKKRRMADDTLKLWISGEFDKKLGSLATKDQLNGVLVAVENHSAKLNAQGKELEGVRSSIRTLEMESNNNRRSFDSRVRRLIQESMGGQASGSPAGASLPPNMLSKKPVKVSRAH